MSIDTIRQSVQTSVKSKEELDTGWVFSFPISMHDTLQHFIQHEQSCCTFLDFDIETNSKQLSCKVTLSQQEQYDIETVKEIISTLFSNE